MLLKRMQIHVIHPSVIGGTIYCLINAPSFANAPSLSVRNNGHNFTQIGFKPSKHAFFGPVLLSKMSFIDLVNCSALGALFCLFRLRNNLVVTLQLLFKPHHINKKSYLDIVLIRVNKKVSFSHFLSPITAVLMQL